MRILLASEPGVDGVLRHVEGLTGFLLRAGYVVDLAYSSIRGSDRLTRLAARVVEAGGLSTDLRVGSRPGVGDLGALVRLRHLMKRGSPDVLHGHSSKAGALLRTLRLLGNRRPTFYTPHAYYGMGRHSAAATLVFNSIERALEPLSHTINLSEGEARFAREVLRTPTSRQTLIHNGVNPELFRPADPGLRADLRRRAGIPDGALVLGTVGRFSPQKDPVTLYGAFAMAAARIPNLVLYHLGAGELEAEALAIPRAAGVANRVFHVRYLSEPVAFYQCLDGFVLASIYEGFAYCILEAMACNLPMILSTAPGNEAFFQLGLTHCWQVPPRRHGDFAAAIEHWASQGLRGNPCNHRAVACERFSEEVCFSRVLALYCEAVRGP